MSTPIGQTNLGESQTRGSQGQGMTGQGQALSGQSQGITGSENRMMSGSGQHQEGTVARTIEQQTSKLPSDTFLWAAVGSIGASAVLRMLGKKNASLFVGEWVAPMLLFGVYNKIVKLHGSDRGH